MANDQVPQYAILLRRRHLFRSFNDVQIAHVVALFKPLEIDTGKVIFAEGARAESFYIIYKGKVKVTVQKVGEERLVNVLGAGEYFGDEALLYDRPREATVTTLEPTVVLTLD